MLYCWHVCSDRKNVARSLSLVGIFAIALNFHSPPVAGLIHDATGSYTMVLFSVIGACLVASALLLLLAVREQPGEASLSGRSLPTQQPGTSRSLGAGAQAIAK
jgi:hypothetical protein